MFNVYVQSILHLYPFIVIGGFAGVEENDNWQKLTAQKAKLTQDIGVWKRKIIRDHGPLPVMTTSLENIWYGKLKIWYNQVHLTNSRGGNWNHLVQFINFSGVLFFKSSQHLQIRSEFPGVLWDPIFAGMKRLSCWDPLLCKVDATQIWQWLLYDPFGGGSFSGVFHH